MLSYLRRIVSFAEHPSAFTMIFFSDAKFVCRYCSNKNFQSSSLPFLMAVQYTAAR